MKAEDLRAEIARQQVHIYDLASKIGLHPGRLGGMLNGRLPLPQDVAERVSEALQRDRAVAL